MGESMTIDDLSNSPERQRHACPRMATAPPGPLRDFCYENKPDDGTCDYCGSILPDVFMGRLEAGNVTLDPTDKTYKVYVHNDGGEPFRQSYRTDDDRSEDQSQWVWTTREQSQAKFYFQHLTENQRKRFVELLREGKLRLNYPGRFYVLPFFITMVKA
jgi:hypothetical protein